MLINDRIANLWNMWDINIDPKKYLIAAVYIAKMPYWVEIYPFKHFGLHKLEIRFYRHPKDTYLDRLLHMFDYIPRYLGKDHSNPAYVKRVDEPCSASSAESLDILLNAHFLGGSDVFTSEINLSADVGKAFVTPDRIAWAIESFSPYKSPGIDGILPKMLQGAQCLIIPWLPQIYRLCLLIVYLSYFLLKMLERIIDVHISQKAE